MIYWRSIAALVLSLVATATAQVNGSVRLVDGASPNCGRVEVFFAGEWGSVCSVEWDKQDADVVCNQLGFHRGAASWWPQENATNGSSDRPTVLECPLSDCRHGGRGEHNCTNGSNVVHVCCDPRPASLPVRLTCPPCTEPSSCRTCPSKSHPHRSDCRPQSAVTGIVEVMVNGEWGPIPAEGWDVNEATVVCGQLGYPISYPQGAAPPMIGDIWPQYGQLMEANLFGTGSGALNQSLLDECQETHLGELELLSRSLSRSLLQGLECSGTETELLNCSMTGVGSQPNTSRRVAAVRCGFLPHFNCLPPAQKTIRLRAGAVQWKGRVEVKRSSKWGTVCDRGFDETEGNIVCRGLGYGTVKSISGYGRGVGEIHFTNLRCTGRETRIENCLKSTDTQSCGHAYDVGVECRVPDSSKCSQDTLHNVVMRKDGVFQFPQLMGRSGWGVFCHSWRTPTVTREVGDVICKQTLGQFLRHASSFFAPPTGFNGVYYSGSIRCSLSARSLSECVVNVSPQRSCRNGYTTLRCTSARADLVPDVARLRSSLQSFFALQDQPMLWLQCALQEGCLGRSASQFGSSRKLLTFDSLTWNYGLADFRPVTYSWEWQYHSCHDHYHSMEEFVHYNVFYAGTTTKAAEGHKASFCLEDSMCAAGHSPLYGCSRDNQAISVNCGDLYGQSLDCQWVDITGLRYGDYLLELSVNPRGLGAESDYGNNNASCRIRYQFEYKMFIGWEDTLEVGDCWLSDH